jgi:hypothetical protein
MDFFIETGDKAGSFGSLTASHSARQISLDALKDGDSLSGGRLRPPLNLVDRSPTAETEKTFQRTNAYTRRLKGCYRWPIHSFDARSAFALNDRPSRRSADRSPIGFNLWLLFALSHL